MFEVDQSSFARLPSRKRQPHSHGVSLSSMGHHHEAGLFSGIPLVWPRFRVEIEVNL